MVSTATRTTGFQLKRKDRYVAGFNKMTSVREPAEAVKHQAGSGSGAVRLSALRNEMEAIVLERGITHDSAFEEWCRGSLVLDSDEEPSPRVFGRT